MDEVFIAAFVDEIEKISGSIYSEIMNRVAKQYSRKKVKVPTGTSVGTGVGHFFSTKKGPSMTFRR